MSAFFTADTHFCHKGALAYRPWAQGDVEVMNEVLIFNWNAVVKPEDEVYHLGDLCCAGLSRTVAVLERLNGTIKLVRGNHDDRSMMRRLEELGLIKRLDPLQDIKVALSPDGSLEPARFTLCHYPMHVWNRMHHGAIHLHGHSHGNLVQSDQARRMDVGVDAEGAKFGGAPIPMGYILGYMSVRSGVYHDHHLPAAA